MTDAGGPRRLVAIVDDDDSVRPAVHALLSSIGMDVRPFRSAEDFLNSSLSREVACVITDVNMPGMSGFELQQRLLARGSRVPVVFITAFGDPAMRARALRAGACGFLEKPFEDDDLIESVRRAIRT